LSGIVNKVREFLLEKCEQHKQNPKWGYYDYWNDHIKRVVYHAVNLANEHEADVEIVELGALLHDVSMPSEYGDRQEHHVYSAEMAEKLLTELDYPKDKLELVKKCVFHHPNRVGHLRETIEEYCVSDADALAHFDRVPSLFCLAYNIFKMPLVEGREYVKERLQGDYDGLSEQSKILFKEKFDKLMEIVFVD